MKKVLLSLIVMLLLTGCSANYTIKSNVKKECKKYETVLATEFGGGEGESSGTVEYGLCDNHFIQSEASKKGTFSLKYNYSKHDYNDAYYDLFKGNSASILVMTKKYTTKDDKNEYGVLYVDYVIGKSDIKDVLDILEQTVLPAVGTTIKEDNIYINLYTKNKTMEQLESLKSYIVMTDKRWNETTINLSLGGKIMGEGYKDGVKGNDTKSKLKISIDSFKSFYAG